MVGTAILVRFKEHYSALFEGHKVGISELFASDPFIRTLKAKNPCHLRVNVEAISHTGTTLSIKILSYHIGEGTFSPIQYKNSELFSKITSVIVVGGSDTSKLYWMGLVNLSKPKSSEIDKDEELPTSEPKAVTEKSEKRDQMVSPEIEKHKITLSIAYPIEKLNFNDGKVSFLHEITQLSQPFEVEIRNYFISHIHDSIKPYFCNVLNTKKINVTVSIEYTIKTGFRNSETQILFLESKSQEIDSITPELIEKAKLKFTKNQITKTQLLEKSLFTKDEFLLYKNENKEITELYKNDEELLDAFLKISIAMHHNHLLLLSEMHDYKTMKLKFIPKPISFMFLIAGKMNYHFVWETSNTKEATYIWSVPKYEIESNPSNLQVKLNEMDSIVTEIIQEGKNSYIIKKAENFKRIFHKYTENLDGFRRWKVEFEDAIV